MLFVSHSKYKLELLFVGLIIVIGGLGYAAYTFSRSPSASTIEQPAGPVVIKGTLLCLPHRTTSGPQTTECAYGLKDAAGRYYALNDAKSGYKNLMGIPTNTQVEVIGTYTPKEDTKYQSNGLIAVTSITRVSIDVPVSPSGVRGTVTVGPTCPVERMPPDPTCADRPLQIKLQLMTADAKDIIKTFSSDKNGNYEVTIAPGTYAIRSPQEASIFPSCTSGTVVVKARTFTTMKVTCDSGIR